MPATRIDLRRELRPLYTAGRAPRLVEVPELHCLWIDGRGAPASPSFTAAVQALYSLAWTARFALKRAGDGIEYPVLPLEGLWPAWGEPWAWSLLIVQPDVVTPDVLEAARTEATRKRPLERVEDVRLERFHEGLCAQVMHVGPYAEEQPTIERLHGFIAAEGLVPAGPHHEIYLGDPRRSAPERLRTILRQPVAGGERRARVSPAEDDHHDEDRSSE